MHFAFWSSYVENCQPSWPQREQHLLERRGFAVNSLPCPPQTSIQLRICVSCLIWLLHFCVCNTCSIVNKSYYVLSRNLHIKYTFACNANSSYEYIFRADSSYCHIFCIHHKWSLLLYLLKALLALVIVETQNRRPNLFINLSFGRHIDA